LSKLLHPETKCEYTYQGKKILGHCEHKTQLMGQEFHEEGICWRITQEEFKDFPTNSKYCPCSRQPGLIRRYARTGYMERGEHDRMITRPCSRCGKDFLFTINTHTCAACKVLTAFRG